MTQNIPPPPPGFTLQGDGAASAVPPPPPGFQMAQSTGIGQPPGVPTYVPPGVTGYDPTTGEVAPDQNTTPMDKVGAFAASVVNGVPIAGPALLKGLENVGGEINALSKGTSQADEKYAAQQATDRAIADNPHTATAGALTGAVAGTMPLVAAAPGAFGVGAASLPIRIAMSTGSGAILGGADAAVRSGGDLDQTERGAGWGALGGAASIPVGAVIGKLGSAGAQKVADAMYWLQHGSDLPSNAAESLVSNLGRQGDTVSSALQSQSAMGTGATLADTGPAAQGMAVKLAAQYPEVGPQMSQNLTARADQFAQRMNSAVDAAAGADINAPQQVAALKATTAANGKTNYDAAFAAPAPVDVKPIVAAIDAQTLAPLQSGVKMDPISKALTEARNYIAGYKPGAMGLETLHKAQDVIDDMASSAFRSGDNSKARALWGVRTQLLGAMDKANPAYAAARSQYASDKSIESAFENGRSIFAPRVDGQVYDPDLLESRLASMSQPEKDAFQLGTRKALTDTMGMARSDAAGVKTRLANEGGYATQKLRQVIGDPQTDSLLKELDNQAAMQATNNVVLHNSKTAMATAADADIPQAKLIGNVAQGGGDLAGAYIGSKLGGLVGGYFGHPDLGEAAGLGLAAGAHKVSSAINAGREAAAAAGRSSVADALTGPARQKIIDAMMAYEKGRPNTVAIGQNAAMIARALAQPGAQAMRLLTAQQGAQ